MQNIQDKKDDDEKLVLDYLKELKLDDWLCLTTEQIHYQFYSQYIIHKL